MRKKGAQGDGAVAAIAARQHGIVTTAQLAAAGLSPAAVTRRVRAGRLNRVHQGVYAVGHDGLSDEGWWLAAVFACGPGAVLSHASAAALWGFIRAPKGGPVHVSLPSRSGRKRRAGICIHRPQTLAYRDISRRSEIPLTTPRRTIADLRRSDPDLARRAAREAQHTGFGRVKTDKTRSDLESDFLAFCRRHRIFRPEVNVPLRTVENRTLTADFLWRSHALVVETDSYRHHQGEVSFEDDHARDLALRRLGFTVLRYTGRQLEREAEPIAAEVRTRLAS